MPQYHKSYRARRDISIAKRKQREAEYKNEELKKENDLLRLVSQQRELL